MRIVATLAAATLAVVGGAVAPVSAQAPTVVLRTNLGAITIELDPVHAPLTVENFLRYVRDGFYDGTIIHRVIPGFVVQGGGFESGLVRKPTRAPIVNEAAMTASNLTGTIAMARTSVVDSATSQFFINLADNTGLDFRAPTTQGYGYAVFGRVIGGMDVVRRIEAVATATVGIFEDVPVEDVVVLSASEVLPCPGDCDGDGSVTVDEILSLLAVSLGTADVASCSTGDLNADGAVTVDEILSAIIVALLGCTTA